MMRNRIRGALGRAMVEAALAEVHDDWAEGQWDTFGLKTSRGMWRAKMSNALEAAFEKLLEEPARPAAQDTTP